MLVTLLVWRADGEEVTPPIKDEYPPVKVFADMSIFSSGICMYWNRTAINTPGGEFRGQFTINDGTGCLTTRIGDLAVFVDGSLEVIMSEMTSS
jgi:hypothetical protein